MKIDLTKADPCAKLTTVAIVEKDGKYWLGTNSCLNPQESCPRGDMPSGVGYELCNDICQQTAHAEVNAMKAAGKKNCDGANLYLFGHYRVCENCQQVAEEMNIKKIFIINDEAVLPFYIW